MTKLDRLRDLEARHVEMLRETLADRGGRRWHRDVMRDDIATIRALRLAIEVEDDRAAPVVWTVPMLDRVRAECDTRGVAVAGLGADVIAAIEAGEPR